MKPGLKIGILSLGCPRNLVDSESIVGRLNLKGCRITTVDKADIAVINTCAFIEDAKAESIEAILSAIDLKKQGRIRKIILYGCLVERYKDELAKELPQIDALVGRISLNHDSSSFSITAGHYAYLKICEGCINNCSYCIIPKLKGRFSSLDMGSVLKKAGAFNQRGVSELNIIGQDITGYGKDLYGHPRLAGLLKKIIARTPKIGWIRLLYLNPGRLGDELIGLIRDEPRLCKYIDLPIQHINERILKLMNRQTTKKEILKFIDKIRKEIPGVAIRTSLIVGFPSETEEEFRELTGFVRDYKLERLGAFIYSREEGTKAASFGAQIPARDKLKRLNEVMSIQQEVSREINSKFLGEVLEVLIDGKEDGAYLGRSQYDAPEVDGLVYVSSKKALKPGEFIKVKIKDTMEYDLVGEVV